MSLTNPDAIVTEERLAEFYQTIFPYLGGMPDILANKFAKGDMYSTDEKMIGRWIDGKPLYQKTVDCGALPNATSKEVAHNISNVSNIVSCAGQAFDSSGVSIPLPFQNVEMASQGVSIYANRTIVKLSTGIDRSSLTNSYVTLQYTKAIDSAVYIGDDTDYSTTEKIVGTWIDGKPLYQKTISNGPYGPMASGWFNLCPISNFSNNIDNLVGSYYTLTAADAGNPMTGYFHSRVINGYLQMYNIDSAWANTPVSIITLRYTKTTD